MWFLLFCTCLYVCIYIYTRRERERERGWRVVYIPCLSYLLAVLMQHRPMWPAFNCTNGNIQFLEIKLCIDLYNKNINFGHFFFSVFDSTVNRLTLLDDKSPCTLLNLRGTTDHNIPAELSIPELVASIQIRTE